MTTPDIYREFDVEISRLVRGARDLGHDIPCKRGCSHCCSDVAVAYLAELGPLVKRLRTFPVVARDKIRRRLVAWIERAQANGIEPGNPEPDIRAWFEAKLVCPLLDPERRTCLVYNERPIACRGHFVIDTSPDVCAKRGLVPPIMTLNTETAVNPWMTEYLMREDATGTVFMAVGLLPTLLAIGWKLVENPSVDVDAWVKRAPAEMASREGARVTEFKGGAS